MKSTVSYNIFEENTKTSDLFGYVLSAVVFLILGYFGIVQDAIVDATDGVYHYQHAKFSFRHPELFFNHWAKPVFTFLMSGPAQFGLKGIVFANTLLIFFACVLSFKAAKELKFSFYFLTPLIIGLGNSVSYVVLGGLTEPLFIFGFSLVIYLIVHVKFQWALFVAGGLILVRPESVVVVFGLLFIIRHWSLKGFIALATLPVVCSVLGSIIADYPLLYVLTHQPYGGKNVYGYGSWFHYLKNWDRLSTFTALAMFLIGSFFVVKNKNFSRVILFLLFTGFGIVFLHVILWKFGILGSAGLVRTLTTALPAISIVSVYSLSSIKPKYIYLLGLITAVLISIEFVTKNKYPLNIENKEVAAKLVAEKITDLELINENNKIFYQFATTAYYLSLDPFDEEHTSRLWGLDKATPSKRMKPGDLIIWDNITGHKEGGIVFDVINSDEHLVKVDSVVLNKVQLFLFVKKQETN
jgi:hypothetical protein